jgi:hypothetical protein
MSVTQYSDNHEHWQRQPAETQIIDGLPVRFSDLCVYEFAGGDVEDTVSYAGEPLLLLLTWQESAAGQWVMANAEETPYWVKDLDYNQYQYRFRVMARLSEFNQTFFRLKYGTGR